MPVTSVNTRHFQSPSRGDGSAQIRARVIASRERQHQRQQKTNGRLSGSELETVCSLDESQRDLLEDAMENLGLSARAYHRTLRVARTLADMEGVAKVSTDHLTEALGYRTLDRRKTLNDVSA